MRSPKNAFMCLDHAYLGDVKGGMVVRNALFDVVYDTTLLTSGANVTYANTGRVFCRLVLIAYVIFDDEIFGEQWVGYWGGHGRWYEFIRL